MSPILVEVRKTTPSLYRFFPLFILLIGEYSYRWSTLRADFFASAAFEFANSGPVICVCYLSSHRLKPKVPLLRGRLN